MYPFITYCNTVWSSTYVTYLNRIYYLQKRAVRAVTNSDFRAHTAPLFAKLDIRYFKLIYFTLLDSCSVIIRKFYHQYFIIFLCSNQLHSYNTRLEIRVRSNPSPKGTI